MQFIFWALLIYILYRFTVGFIIPVVRATSKMRQQFKNMQQQATAFQSADANHQQEPQTGFNSDQHGHPNWTTSGKKAPKEDYIDFEEVPKPWSSSSK